MKINKLNANNIIALLKESKTDSAWKKIIINYELDFDAIKLLIENEPYELKRLIIDIFLYQESFNEELVIKYIRLIDIESIVLFKKNIIQSNSFIKFCLDNNIYIGYASHIASILSSKNISKENVDRIFDLYFDETRCENVSIFKLNCFCDYAIMKIIKLHPPAYKSISSPTQEMTDLYNLLTI
jgi:hypothetical protein